MATLVQAPQRSDEWYKARIGKATASRFGDIMATTRSGYAASRKNYAAELVAERLTGLPASIPTSAAMQWGTDTEPLARLNYELTHGAEVLETGFWVHDYLDCGASPDGFVSDDGIVEIKCPNTATHIETLTSRSLPYKYKAQVQGQLWITDRLWCDFISYDPRMPDNAQMVVIHVDRDEAYILQLERNIRAFLEEVDKQTEFIRNYR